MPQDKDALRAEVRENRARLTPRHRARGDAARTLAALELLAGLGERGAVAAYVSTQEEPSTIALIDALHAARRPVLLPVLGSRVAWGWFEGWERTVASWRGIPQPMGTPLDASALGQATVIVVPCLAVGRDGSRLGTGGGWYDRALLHRAAGSRVIALARDAELYPTLPVEAHDLGVDAVATESGVVWFEARP